MYLFENTMNVPCEYKQRLTLGTIYLLKIEINRAAVEWTCDKEVDGLSF